MTLDRARQQGMAWELRRWREDSRESKLLCGGQTIPTLAKPKGRGSAARGDRRRCDDGVSSSGSPVGLGYPPNAAFNRSSSPRFLISVYSYTGAPSARRTAFSNWSPLGTNLGRA